MNPSVLHPAAPLLVPLLLLVAGCGSEPPAEPEPGPPEAVAPAEPTEPEPEEPAPPEEADETEASAQSGDPGAADSSDGATMTPDPTEDSDVSEAGEAPPEADTAPGSPDLAEVFHLKREGKFSEALLVLRTRMAELENGEARQRLRGIEVQLRRLQRNSVGLQRAVDTLAAETPAARQFAVRRLRTSREAGAILLRKAVRDASPEIAEEAGYLLLEREDEEWPDSALERIAEDLDAEIALDLLRLLGEPERWLTATRANRMAAAVLAAFRQPGKNSVPDVYFETLAPSVAELDAALWPEALRLVLDDEEFEDHRLVLLLGEAYERICDEESAAFGELVGDPKAVEKLETSMLDLMQTAPEEDRAWVAAGFPFVPMVPGWLGQYYRGPDKDRFQEHVVTRIDAKIQISRNQFPQGQENIAVRWTGMVKIDEPGTYTFVSASDDGQRLWVGDSMLIDDWNYHGVQTKSGQIKLEPGMHPIRVEFFQGSGGASITVTWSGPKFERTLLTGKSVWTRPAPEDETAEENKP